MKGDEVYSNYHSTMFLLTIFVVFFLMIFFKFVVEKKKIYDDIRRQGIPAEPFVPFLGQLKTLRRYRDEDRLFEFYEELNKKHGHIFLCNVGPTPRLVVSDPDWIGEILNRQNASNYVKPSIAKIFFKPLIGLRNLLVAEGEEHERMRHMLNPAFHHLNIKSMIPIMMDRTTKTIDSILNSSTDRFDLQLIFNSLSLSVIVSSAFGADLETNERAKHLLTRVLKDVLDATVYRTYRMLNVLPLIRNLPIGKKTIIDVGTKEIGEFVDKVIIDRRQGHSMSLSGCLDLLDLLLSAADQQGKSLSDDEIKEQALSFVLAGSETTGNLLVWIFFVLMTNENLLHDCLNEIDQIVEINEENLDKLQICEAIIYETLRLYPPAPLLPRRSTCEHRLGQNPSIRLPADIEFQINTYLLHRRADLWPRPTEFDYHRWLRDPQTGLKPKLVHPFAYLPFASGPRNCIGQNFALIEVKIVMAMFLQRCHFKMIPNQKIVGDVGISLRTKYGLWATMNSREK